MTIEDLQLICKEMKAVTEDIKWGDDLVFSVGGKMFFVAGPDRSPVTASFKVADAFFDEMCSQLGFKPAPYLARYKWVFVDDINKIKAQRWREYLKTSYTLVKDKLSSKLKKQLELE